jgi:hypothetical protein
MNNINKINEELDNNFNNLFNKYYPNYDINYVNNKKFDDLLNKEVLLLEKKEENHIEENHIEENHIEENQIEEQYKKNIEPKLFINCMKISDNNFRYLNERINELKEEINDKNIKIKVLSDYSKKIFLHLQKYNENVNEQFNTIYKDMYKVYTKYDDDLSSSFKHINNNTKKLLELITYNSNINNLILNNKLENAEKLNKESNNKSKKRKAIDDIKIIEDTIDNSSLYPRKSVRLSFKDKTKK